MINRFYKPVIAMALGALIPSLMFYYEQRHVATLQTELKLQAAKMAMNVAEQGLQQVINRVDGTCVCPKIELMKHLRPCAVSQK